MKASEFLNLPMKEIEKLFSHMTREQLLSVSAQVFELIECNLLIAGLAGSLGSGEPLSQARHDALAFHDLVWSMILGVVGKYKRDMSKLN